MTLEIIQRRGIDGGEVVAVWEEGEGIVESKEGLRWADDPAFARYDEEQVLAEFDGPDYFAVPR